MLGCTESSIVLQFVQSRISFCSGNGGVMVIDLYELIVPIILLALAVWLGELSDGDLTTRSEES